MTEPQDATWWAEIEESLGHRDAAQQARAGHVAPFGPTGNETTAIALHPSGRDPRPVTGNPLSEIRRQLDRIEHLDLARIRTALRWIAVLLALQIGVTVASTLAVLAR